jgi:hypothetical protein
MISRRDLLKYSGLACLAPQFTAFAQSRPEPDYRIEIAAVTLDLATPFPNLKRSPCSGSLPPNESAPWWK